jgi:hypothetical protein
LSADGSKCFLSDCDEDYIVWDIATSTILWSDNGASGHSTTQSLTEWISSDGWIQIADSTAAQRYRIFGLEHNHAKNYSADLDIVLDVQVTNELLLLKQGSTNHIVCELKYEAFSGDWAFASFSENDATIAVLEPYYVTFYQRLNTSEPSRP